MVIFFPIKMLLAFSFRWKWHGIIFSKIHRYNFQINEGNYKCYLLFYINRYIYSNFVAIIIYHTGNCRHHFSLITLFSMAPPLIKSPTNFLNMRELTWHFFFYHLNLLFCHLYIPIMKMVKIMQFGQRKKLRQRKYLREWHK